MSHKIPESILVVIHNADLEVLLIERAKDPDFWQSVTGSKDTIEESLAETAIREVLEETGIRIVQSSDAENPGEYDILAQNLQDWNLTNTYEIYPSWRYRYAPNVTHNTEHVFGLLVPKSIPVVLEPREHLRYAWLPYQDAADRCFSSSNAEAILQLPQRHSGGK